MAGLLDFDDPGMRMGLGLLAASQAPRAQSGQVLMGLLNSMDQLDERKANAKYREAQIAEMQRKASQADNLQRMMTGMFSQGGQQAAPQINMDDGPPDPAQIQAATQQRPSGNGFSPNFNLAAVTALHGMGGPNLLENWKLAQTGAKVDAGNYYVKDGQSIYAPKLPEGIGMDPRTGRTFVIPGYADANAAIEGAKTGAVEGAKFPYTIGANRDQQNTAASLDVTKVWNPQSQREEFATRAQVAKPQNFQGPGYNGGSVAEAAKEQLFIMQREYDKLPPGPDKDAVAREMQRLGGSPQSGNYAAGPSASELAANEAAKVRATDTAKADVVRDSARQADAKRFGQMSEGISRAIDLLNQQPTASGLGSVVDKGLGTIGAATRGGELASRLETLSGWLVSNVPRMEGPQSDRDAQNYQAMAGTVGDRTKPIATRLAAAQEVQRLQEKYAALNGGASGKQADSAPQQREFSMLPKASDFDGKRMRAPDGTIYRSSGGRWVKE